MIDADAAVESQDHNYTSAIHNRWTWRGKNSPVSCKDLDGEQRLTLSPGRSRRRACFFVDNDLHELIMIDIYSRPTCVGHTKWESTSQNRQRAT